MGEHNTMGKSDGTTNRIIVDIRKSIHDEFNNNVRIFMVNKYSGSRRILQTQKRRAIQISNKWTKPTETTALMLSPQMEPQKTRSPLRANASVFLFGTAAMACQTTNNKQPQDDDTTVCSYETQSMFH